jgi:hypothetical protein
MKKRTRANGGGSLINFTIEGSTTTFCCDQTDWDQYELKMKIAAYGVPDRLINDLVSSAYREGSNDAEQAHAEDA